MAATEVRGLDVLIKIGSQVVGGQRNASLELSAESIDATCKTTGGWSKKLPGIKTWSSSCDGIYFLSDAGITAVQAAFKNSQEVELEFSNTEGIYFKGKAIITSMSIELGKMMSYLTQ